MNQKLRTARYSIAILLAILCIVCLSLSLAFSAQFAAFAAGEDEVLAPQEAGNDLWLIHYTDADGSAKTQGLWSGIHDGEAIKYLGWDDVTNSAVLSIGTNADSEKYFYAPYRATELTLALNGDYIVDPNGAEGARTLSDLYDLENARYENATNIGDSNCSIPVNTSVIVDSTTGEDALTISKQWMIAPLCNTIQGGVPEGYVGDRAYADKGDVELLTPEMGNAVVYDFINGNDHNAIAAVRREGDVYTYYPAYLVDEVNYGIDINADVEFTSEDAERDVNYINYTLRRLKAGDYTLKVVAMSPSALDENYMAGAIYYSSGSQSITFNVSVQTIEDLAFERLFGTLPTLVPNTHAYTGNYDWLNNIDYDLSIDGLKMEKGVDYDIEATSFAVGYVDLRIVGRGNLTGFHTIENAILITPAINDWDVLPNITPWSYGDYDKSVNRIVGLPTFPLVIDSDNINDITFRIVLLVNGEEIDIEGLNDIHFLLPGESGEFLVSDDIATKLAALGVGSYRLYASVNGVASGSATTNWDRDYYQLEERFVNFNITKNKNSWDSEEGVPSIVSWTAGKYNPEVNVITATDRFGNEAIIIIRDGNGEIVYSNDPKYADESFSKLDVLKKFKAGYYTLEAKVKGTENYEDLDTLITFTIARNGLPSWAVILIVVGALSVVALTLGLLHQKGILQMLTGKVIIAMRTRANVDATLAAIRAAKVARDAEASIAAAKAREAEDAAKENKDK